MEWIRFLGTGNAFNLDGRLSQAILLQPTGGGPFLVDMGPTTTLAMEKLGIDAGALERIFVTHLHGDHTAGWPFLLLTLAYLRKRVRPLDVYGPLGTRRILETLVSACYGDIFAGDRETFEIRYHEIPVAEDRGRAAGGDLRFDVVPVDHHPSSVGYCFHSGDRRVGITGDTRWCPGLERLAELSDVLVVECTSIEKQDYAHVSLDELRAARSRLASERIVLVHLMDSIEAALARDPIPGVVAATDGWLLEL
jgi:ribonuclease BN (tRNA processing enzyme)